MNRKLVFAATFAVLATVSHAFAGDSQGTQVTVETTSSGTVGKCEASVSRSLKVCDEDGKCKRQSLDDETRFSVPSGGSFVVSASVSYMQDGVIHGDAAVDRFETFDDGERLIQTIKTGERCSQVFSYELHAR